MKKPAVHLSDTIIVGRVGENQLAEGWHERETDGRYGIPYRSTTDDGHLRLRRRPGATRLYTILTGPVSLHGGRMHGYMIVNRQKYELPLKVDTWVLRSFDIDPDPQATDLHVRLYLKDPIVPDHVLHNGDARKLGWYLSAIWQQ